MARLSQRLPHREDEDDASDFDTPSKPARAVNNTNLLANGAIPNLRIRDPNSSASSISILADDGDDGEEDMTADMSLDSKIAAPIIPKTPYTPRVSVAHLEPIADTVRTLRKAPLADITERENINSAISGIAKSMQKVTLDTPSLEATPVVALSPRKTLFSDPPPVPKQRLIIHKLVLNNFKSYAGRQEIGPFNSSFSAVVGPNGSGKSNVIDSLLFVFGFRASKMRHTKISSLIHSSAAQPNLTSCSVEVYFHDVADDASGNSTIVPDTQLVVTRKAFKNNSSQYTINGSSSSFTEVTDLLKNRGIDLDHKRFLILQGEVESISQMKAKAENEHDDGLLEYLEDIIGTSQYKNTIETAATEVDTLNEECVEKTNRLQIVEKELNSLEGAKNTIVNYLETENDITHRKSALLQLNIHLCNARIDLSTKVIDEQRAKLQQEIETTAGNKEQVEHLNAEYSAKSRELGALKKRLQESSKALSKREMEKVQIEEKKKHLETKRKKLEKTIAAAEHSYNESRLWLDNYDEEMAGLKQQIESSQQKLEKESQLLVQIQDELKDKTQVFTDQIDKIQVKLEPWRTKISAKESEVDVAKSQVDMLQERANASKAAIDEAKAKIHEIQTQGREKEQALQALKDEQEHVTSQLSLGTTEVREASQKLAKMNSRLNAMRQELASVKESATSADSQNKVLTGLTKLSKSGRLEGFHGRLGGLGTIDKKYDVAISTACPMLENIVVETVEAGQQCVEYLRKNQLGRAKFILLDKLPQRDLSPIETPENVPRLFDLVNVRDDKFRQAFFSIMSNTLVAKDAAQARRIAYGKRRYRVVTLDGVLIDVSGTMSGGGNTPRSGAMRSQAVRSVSEETIRASEEQLTEYETRVKTAEATLLHMQNALKELQERKPKVELDISKAELDINSLGAHLKEAVTSHKELVKEADTSTKAGSIEQELKQAESVVSKRSAELASLKQQSKSLEDEIAALQEKIMEAGGVRLRMQKSTVDSLKDQIELWNTRVSNGVVDKNKAENEVKKHQRVLDSSQKELAGSADDAQNLTTEFNDKLKAIAEVEAQVESLTNNLDDGQEALDSMKTELEEKQREINKVRSAEIEIKNKIDQHEKSLREDSQARTRWREKFGELSLHDVRELRELRTIKKEKAAEDRGEVEAEAEPKNEDDSEPEVEAESEGDAEVNRAESESADNDDSEKAERDDDDDTTELTEYSADELEAMNKDHIRKEIEKLEDKIKDTRVDMQVLKDYRRRIAEYQDRRGVLNEAVSRRDSTKKMLDDLKQKRMDEFMAGFNAISIKLKEMYQMITMGGNAELELVDSLDPFSEGIIFSVMPPKKSWRNISNLSGGEKTLSSLALVFALHHYKPTPLYVMDEIDAALDFRNVSIVATYIKERTKNGQFIVISLRNNMFELAQQLVGIYKVNNMTRSVALENRPIV